MSGAVGAVMAEPACADDLPHTWTENPEEVEGCRILQSIERCAVCGLERLTYRDAERTVTRYARGWRDAYRNGGA